MLSNQNTTFIVCMLVNDWKGLGFNGLFVFSHWMMLVQVFLILMCIIFEHGSVAFTVGTVSSQLDFIGRSGGSSWVCDGQESVCWVKGVDWSMPCYCQTVTVNIGNLHLTASSPPPVLFLVWYPVLGQNCISLIAKCLNIVQFHSLSHIRYCKTHQFNKKKIQKNKSHLWATRSSESLLSVHLEEWIFKGAAACFCSFPTPPLYHWVKTVEPYSPPELHHGTVFFAFH